MVGGSAQFSRETRTSLYLLDASVLIDAATDYYPLDRVPDYWSWLVGLGKSRLAAIPKDIWDKVSLLDDPLAKWLRKGQVIDALVDRGELVEQEAVESIQQASYGHDLSSDEKREIAEDSKLVALADNFGAGTCLVTSEKPSPSKRGKNRKLPDVCKEHGVRCIDPFEFIREADFKTISANAL